MATVPALPALSQLAAPRFLPGDATPGPAAGDQRNVAIARGSNQALMVWEDSRGGLSGTVDNAGSAVSFSDLFAARLDGDGTLIDTSPLLLDTGSFAQGFPKVAWNGSNYLVVWCSYASHQYNNDGAIYAMRVSPQGQALDTPPLVLADEVYEEEFFPALASNGVDWAVTWNGDEYEGCIVAADGTVGPTLTLFNPFSFYMPRQGELAWSGGRYLFVSEHFPNGGSTNHCFAQFFDAALNKIGGEFDLGVASNYGTNPSVASNGSSFCVAWLSNTGGMRATPVSATGAIAVPGGIALSNGLYVDYNLAGCTWDGANWVVAFTAGNAWSSASVRVTHITTAGAVLFGSQAIEQGAWEMERPACVQTTNGALVVWSDGRNATGSVADRLDLFGATVAQDGSFAASACLSMSPPAQTDADIAGSFSSGFLIAFLSQTQSTATIHAQRVNASGVAFDAQPIVVSSGIREKRNPAVAWSGGVWLVVWEEMPNGSPNGNGGVFGARVAANGAVLDATPILIMPGNTPDVAALGGEFLIAASHEPVNHKRYIYTRRVRASDGALVDAAPQLISTGLFAYLPTVEAFADRWVVAWSRTATHDSGYSTASIATIQGATVSPVLMAGDGTGSVNTQATLACDGTQALLVWKANSEIRGRRFASDLSSPETSAGFVISGANNDQLQPAVGWNGARFTAAWLDYRVHVNPLQAGIGDVFATDVLTNGTVVDPIGVPVAADPRLPEGDVAVAGDLDTSLIACSRLTNDPSFATWRITLSAECPEVATYCTAKTNSLGCVPAIGSSGAPQLGATSGFTISATQIRNNVSGLLLYGLDGPATIPFQNATLCVRAPTMRTPVRFSGGSASGSDCTGTFSLDFNAFATGNAGGSPSPLLAQSGAIVHCQWWGRDPGFAPPQHTTLTDALRFSYCP